MKTKERIISLRLLEQKEKHQDYLKEIGVAVTMKTNDNNEKQTEKQTNYLRGGNDYA